MEDFVTGSSTFTSSSTKRQKLQQDQYYPLHLRETKITSSHRQHSNIDKYMDANPDQLVNDRSVSMLIDVRGGTLDNTNTGVTLEIPPGALEGEHLVKMRTFLNHQDESKVTCVANSPVVVELLPRNMKLLKEAKLILPHGFSLRKGCERKAIIYSRQHETEISNHSVWEEQFQTRYELNDDNCEIWINSLNFTTIGIKSEIIEARRIILYAAMSVPSTATDVILHIGYYLDIPGGKMVLEYNNVIVLLQQPALLFNERQPLSIFFEKTEPPYWTCVNEINNPKEICLKMILSETGGFCSFVMTKAANMSPTKDCTCYFKAEQGSQLDETLKFSFKASVIADTLTSTEQKYLPYKQPHLTLKVEQTVNSNGGKLEIPYSGVTLDIPAGALEGQHLITMKIIPNYQNDDTELSSVVVELLPRNMKLLKRAKLTLPHCLVLKQGGKRKAKIYSSDHEEGELIPNWKEQTDIPYEIMERHGVLWLNAFSLKKYVFGKNQAKGKRVVLYAAQCHPFLSKIVQIHIGYYLDLPGNDQLPLRYNNITILRTQIFIFLKKKGPLEIVFKEIKPPSWTLESESGEIKTQKEILYEDLKRTSTDFCNFVFKKTSTNAPKDCLAYFTASQTSKHLKDLIFPLMIPALSPNVDGNDVSLGAIRELSKRIIRDWRDIARILQLTEYEIERLDDENVQTREVAYQMLIMWKRKHDRSATNTKTALSNALIEVGRRDLVYLLENASSGLDVRGECGKPLYGTTITVELCSIDMSSNASEH